jgi:hypothetical protein
VRSICCTGGRARARAHAAFSRAGPRGAVHGAWERSIRTPPTRGPLQKAADVHLRGRNHVGAPGKLAEVPFVDLLNVALEVHAPPEAPPAGVNRALEGPCVGAHVGLPPRTRNTSGHTQAHTSTHRHTQAHTGTHRHTQAHTGTHRHTQAHTGTHRHTQAHPGTPRHTQAHPGAHPGAHTAHTGTHRHTQSHNEQ